MLSSGVGPQRGLSAAASDGGTSLGAALGGGTGVAAGAPDLWNHFISADASRAGMSRVAFARESESTTGASSTNGGANNIFRFCHCNLMAGSKCLNL
jgi:hypothetical protein